MRRSTTAANASTLNLGGTHVINSFRSLASKGFPSGGYSKSVRVRLHSESSEPTMLLSRTTPDEHLRTPPPTRWPALITLPNLAKFQLVWRRLCDVVLLPSCLLEYTLAAVCVPEYQSSRKFLRVYASVIYLGGGKSDKNLTPIFRRKVEATFVEAP